MWMLTTEQESGEGNSIRQASKLFVGEKWSRNSRD